jgi:hypothetical protein
MAVVDLGYQVRYANSSFRDVFRIDGADGRKTFALEPGLRKAIEPIASGGANGGMHEVKFPDGPRQVSIHAHAFPAPGGTEMLVVRLGGLKRPTDV